MPPFGLHDWSRFTSISHPFSLQSLIPSTLQLTPHSSPPFSTRFPTQTTHSTQPLARSFASIFRRQVQSSIIPTTYSGLDAGPAPGTVVGIVFGSVAGFLLVLWLIYSIFMAQGGTTTAVEEEVVVSRRRSRSPRRSSPRRSSPRRSSPRRPPSSRSHSEVIEVSRQRSPPRRETRRETVILEETRRPAQREDDIVEVIEEHSPPRRVRRESRRESGYRTVDPEAFGGGNRPLRKVSRR